MKEIKTYYSHDVCGGISPWKSTLEVTKAILALANQEISVAGFTDKEVLDLYARHRSQSRQSFEETKFPTSESYDRDLDPYNQNTF